MSEALELTYEELVAAGRLLFGTSFVAHGRWRDGLREAFRRRALETHPDRALALGRDAGELAAEFRAVSDAYRVLSGLGVVPGFRRPAARPPPVHRPGRAGPERRPPRPAGAARRAHAPRPAPSARAAGSAAPDRRAATPWVPETAASSPPRFVPRRRLKLAEFLYYTGRVPWPALVEAIAWQRRQRPALGSIAVDFGFLTPAEVSELLCRRLAAADFRVPFGEYAVREGYLTPYQLLAALGRQLRLQRPIGRFFVERGLVAEADLEAARRGMLSHNLRWS